MPVETPFLHEVINTAEPVAALRAPAAQALPEVVPNVAEPSAEPPAEAEQLAPVGLRLDEAPHAVAFLFVENREGGAKYAIWGRCGDSELPEEVLPVPEKRLTGAGLRSHLVWELMVEFSGKRTLLRRWIKGLRERHGEELSVFIVDLSSSGVPWELLKLKNVGREYLGSAVTTVRWVPALDDDDEDVRPVFEPERCEGGILLHVDPDEQSAITEQLGVFSDFGPPSVDDIRDFQERLGEETSGVALVYLLCHGFVGGAAFDLQLGALADPEKRLKLARLRASDLALFRASKSVVFLNACSSAVLVQNKAFLRDDFQRGFAELFLGKGAKGVVGTIDQVERDRAAALAKRFVEIAAEHPGWTVPRILREVRALVTKELSQAPSEQECDDLYTAFLYVYYGHPLATLHLRGAGKASP